MDLMCVGCKQAPENIADVCAAAREEGMNPSDWVRAEEGTLNEENGHFYCTPCFLHLEFTSGRRFLGVAP